MSDTNFSKTPAIVSTDHIRDALDQLVGYHLRRASVHDLNGAVAALDDAGARPITMSVLLSIVEHPGSTSADICRMLGIKRANIVGLLQQLEARDLFLRKDDPTDQRIQRLYPTKTGLETALDWLNRIRQHEEKTLRRLSIKERAELRRLLSLIWSEEAQDD